MKIVMALCLLTAPSPALAWSHNGHMALAYRAYGDLTPAVRTRVDALLVINPAFSRWVALLPPGVGGSGRGAMLFAIASTWPDQIKDDSGYSDDGTENGNRPSGPTSSQNIGYPDTLRHKYWHFVDRPFSRDGTAPPDIPEPNAQSRIRLFRSVLSSSAPDDLKSYDLVWLLHLVGDVHQPLHCATRVSGDMPAGDAGGNFVAICTEDCALSQTLHAFWDTLLGGGFSIVDAVRVANTLPAPTPGRAHMLDEGAWVRESFALAKSSVYRWPIDSGPGPFRMTGAYRKAAVRLARRQVSLAAARLALVLNGELR
jgi:hypothetical protein